MNNPDTTYAVMSYFPFPLYLGMCLPSTCNSQNSRIIAQALNQFVQSQGVMISGRLIFPYTEPPQVKAGNWVGFFGFGFLALLCIFGIIVEYTNLFGKVDYTDVEESQKDKVLVHSKNPLGKLFISFSFSRNLRKMFWTPQNKGDYLSVFNGIRVISMGYIIFGHIHESFGVLPIANGQEMAKIQTSWYGIFIMGAFYAVDVFFFLSAFLGAYLMIPKLQNSNLLSLILNFVMIYIHRFIRLIPTLALFICLMLTFLNFLGNGPLWEMIDYLLVQPCQKYWWTVLTFSNNFYPPSGKLGCMTVLWYLANDMMFFMLLPVVVLLYTRVKFLGYIASVKLIVANMITVFVLAAVHHHPMTMVKDPNKKEIYHSPYSRFGAYFVGCLFGILYYEWKKSKTNPAYERTPGAIFYGLFENNRIVRYLGQFFGLGIILFLVMITYTEMKTLGVILWPQMASNFFNAFHRVVFCIALLLFFAGAMVGKSKLIRFVFGGSAWGPWAKITFIVYLLHSILITWYYAQANQSLWVTKRVAVYYWFAATIL